MSSKEKLDADNVSLPLTSDDIYQEGEIDDLIENPVKPNSNLPQANCASQHLTDCTTDTPIDLWDECIQTWTLPSSDQQDYAHDLGLLSVSGENNAQVASTSCRKPVTPHIRKTINVSLRPFDKMHSNANAQEAFCSCYKSSKKIGVVSHCCCGEDDTEFDWLWDGEFKSWATQLQEDNREVHFHKHYSSGTAAIRGNQSLATGQHYWEIKMISPVYGTDMMVGVGTAEADLNRNSTKFCSFLGDDPETWGLSYTGVFHHNGRSHCYSPRFGQGSIIGVHLDMWNGTLAFYKNRKPLGIACRGLKGKKLYPMISSTAARSAMKMVCSRSFDSSLQYFCCLALRKMVPSEDNVLDSLSMPPGLTSYLRNNLGWILGPKIPFQCCRSTTKHLQGARNISAPQCPLFLDKSKIHDEHNSQGPSGSNFIMSRQQMPTLCYRHGSGVSKRRRYVCDKQKLFISLMNLSSSEDSEEEDASELVAKRKH